MNLVRRRSVVDVALQQGAVVSAEAATRAKALDRLRLRDAAFRHMTRAAAIGVLVLLSAVIVSPISGSLPGMSSVPSDYFVYLVVRGGERYLFENEEATVGRGQANDIVVDSHSISRQHARFQKTVAGVFVTDLGSTNKTFVNGVQADGPVLLRDGDVIRFGEIEADFRLEPQRLTSMNRVVSRSDPGDVARTTYFIDTIRSGRRMGKGRPLLPPMPVPALNAATDDELKAVFAYLQSIPAIKNAVPEPLPPAPPPAG